MTTAPESARANTPEGDRKGWRISIWDAKGWRNHRYYADEHEAVREYVKYAVNQVLGGDGKRVGFTLERLSGGGGRGKWTAVHESWREDWRKRCIG